MHHRASKGSFQWHTLLGDALDDGRSCKVRQRGVCVTTHSYVWRHSTAVCLDLPRDAAWSECENAAWRGIRLCKWGRVTNDLTSLLPVYNLDLTSAVLILIRLDLHNDFSINWVPDEPLRKVPTGSPLYADTHVHPRSYHNSEVCGRCDCLAARRLRH